MPDLSREQAFVRLQALVWLFKLVPQLKPSHPEAMDDVQLKLEDIETQDEVGSHMHAHYSELLQIEAIMRRSEAHALLGLQAFLFLQKQRKEVINQAVVEARHAILEALTALSSNDASLLMQEVTITHQAQEDQPKRAPTRLLKGRPQSLCMVFAHGRRLVAVAGFGGSNR